MRTNWRTFPAAEVTSDDPSRPLDLLAIFGRSAPFEVDLGCGDGKFLAALAIAHPERDFLGVERMPGRVRAACRRIGDGQLPNARILRAEIMTALGTLLPAATVEVCHLLFSDPWPKRRHHTRRVVSEEFLGGVARVLRPDGLLRIATDHADYFAQMERVCTIAPSFEICGAIEAESVFRSTFESRLTAGGAEIYRMVLRKRLPANERKP